jgi:glycolate oxidase iron-sulfur subunit
VEDAVIGRPSAEHADLDGLLRTCIHCGLCLEVCPTYRASGDEAESPRGRILLVAELTGEGPARTSGGSVGRRRLQREALDRCLGCLACQSVCPSGVRYEAILDEGRAVLGPRPGLRGRLLSFVVDEVLPRPSLLAPLHRVGTFLRGLGFDRLPGPIGALLAGLPRRPVGKGVVRPPRRGDVAVLAGCAQSVYTPEVLGATLALIAACGRRPFVPEGQGCCGALSHHAGSTERARELARRLITVLEGAETVVVPSAGCSAHLARYAGLFVDAPDWATRADRLAGASMDLVTFLDRHGAGLRFTADRRRVAYHPPCHHTHAQGLHGEALGLLDRVPGLERVEVEEAELCCGSAGSYSLFHPDRARQARAEKMGHLDRGRPELILTANPGCELFLDAGFTEAGGGPPVRHLAVYLAERLPAGPASLSPAPRSPRGDAPDPDVPGPSAACRPPEPSPPPG